MYFIKFKKGCEDSGAHDRIKAKKYTRNLSVVNFSTADKFSHVKKVCCKVCCCKPKEKSLTPIQLIYDKGYHKVANDLYIVNLVNTVNKIKAGVAAIIDDDPKVIKKAK